MHPGVVVRVVPTGLRVTDVPTGFDEVLLGSALENAATLLGNGLATASRSDRCEFVRALGVGGSSTARRIHTLGSARRRHGAPGCVGAVTAPFAAVVRQWAIPTALTAAMLGCLFGAISAPVQTTGAAVLAPCTAAACVAVHEAGHLLVVRLLLGRHAGTVIATRRTTAVLHAPLAGWRARVVAAAGPLAGSAFACAGLVLPPPDVVTQFTALVLLVVNVVGLTPVTADGRALLRGTTD